MKDAPSIYALRLLLNGLCARNLYVAACWYVFMQWDIENIERWSFEARQFDGWIKNYNSMLGVSVRNNPMPISLCVNIGLDYR